MLDCNLKYVLIHDKMQEFEFVERKPTAEELFILRESVGWRIGEKEAFENGLKNSEPLPIYRTRFS
jgi:hypothetical protein